MCRVRLTTLIPPVKICLWIARPVSLWMGQSGGAYREQRWRSSMGGEEGRKGARSRTVTGVGYDGEETEERDSTRSLSGTW